MNKFLKTTLQASAAAVVMLAAQPASAITDVLYFGNILNAKIRFDGVGNFSFINAPSGYSFSITDSRGGDSIGDRGKMGPGGWAIGDITIAGPVQSASVTGTQTLTIADGLGNNLTAQLGWDSISTVGTSGGVNINGILNLTSITYTGPHQDLALLSARGFAIETVSFTFIPGQTLTYLKSNAAQTGFTGRISIPDAGATITPFSIALLGLAFTAWKRARK